MEAFDDNSFTKPPTGRFSLSWRSIIERFSNLNLAQLSNNLVGGDRRRAKLGNRGNLGYLKSAVRGIQTNVAEEHAADVRPYSSAASCEHSRKLDSNYPLYTLDFRIGPTPQNRTKYEPISSPESSKVGPINLKIYTLPMKDQGDMEL